MRIRFNLIQFRGFFIEDDEDHEQEVPNPRPEIPVHPMHVVGDGGMSMEDHLKDLKHRFIPYLLLVHSP